MCLIFTRLVENYLQESEKLKRLCEYGLLENIQQMVKNFLSLFWFILN